MCFVLFCSILTIQNSSETATIHFQCRLASMSGRIGQRFELCELLEHRKLRELSEAQLYANEQRRSDRQLCDR